MSADSDLRRLDGNTSLLFIPTGVGETGIASFRLGDDTSFGDQWVGQRRLAVVNMGNHGHVPDIMFPVHDRADLVYRYFHLENKR